MKSPEAIRLNARDNVLVLPFGGTRGETAGGVVLAEDIPPGHKVAAARIARAGAVVKYGHPIGEATSEIAPGAWVHEHNVRTRLGGAYEALPTWRGANGAACATPRANEETARTFMGYPRSSGQPGIRNDLWIVPTVGCINGELRAQVRGYTPPEWIDAVRILEHPYGCSQLGDDFEMTARALAALACHPNAAGVLIVGLGCENLPVSELRSRVIQRAKLGDMGRMRSAVLQEDEPGCVLSHLDDLAARAPRGRAPFPLADLCVGVKCGGSDGYSGLTANPLVGRFSDFLTDRGGTIIATEIPEMFGAEDVIASRICEASVFDDFMALDRWFRDYFVRHNQPIYENPSPGNRKGGITTLEEKSLGAVEKAGNARVTRVLRYGEPIGPEGGVQITFSPGNDLVSCTSLAASGAQIVLFTTGRGTPFGTVVPTIKISTNTQLADRHRDWIDFDAGTLLSGESWNDATERLADYVVAVASGQKTAHERKDYGEIAIFKDGVTM